MFKNGIEGFPYYLGVSSLQGIATRADRVCVLNILGGESRQVTPVSHAVSGGNVAFDTSPGRAARSCPRCLAIFRSLTMSAKASMTD